jgi:hypothetical protein
MNIFLKIKNSIYNPKYYTELLQKPFFYSIKYYLLFSLIVSVVFGSILFVKFLPTAKLIVEKGNQLSNYYPQGVEVVIKDGKASTNIPEPYLIKMPEDLKQEDGKMVPENILVIDTKNKFSLEEFNNYKTLTLLTADSFVYENEQNGIMIRQFKDVKDFKINKSIVDGFMNKIKPYFTIFYPLSAVAILFFTFMVSTAKLIYLLFGGLVLWMIFKIRDIKIDYKKSYQLGVHLATLIVVIDLILTILAVQFHIPFFSTILLIIISFVNIRKESQKNTAV